MQSIKSIGFDMDHTLVPYKREAFEALAFEETLKKFISAGYPEELSKLSFDPNFVIRGLLIDKQRGNILKVDCHKYVKVALHGRRLLDKKERHELYNAQSFKANSFLSIDTFFDLSEVQLFTEIVDYMRLNPGKIKKSFKGTMVSNYRKKVLIKPSRLLWWLIFATVGLSLWLPERNNTKCENIILSGLQKDRTRHCDAKCKNVVLAGAAKEKEDGDSIQPPYHCIGCFC